MSDTIKYNCWSHDGESYYQDKDLVMGKIGDGTMICEGVRTNPDTKVFVTNYILDRIVEEMQEAAGESFGEWSENYLESIGMEAKQELRNLIAAWADRHEKPTFWAAEHVNERPVNAGDYE